MKMARQGLFANTMGTEAAQRRAELAKERQAYLEGNIYRDPLVNIAAQSQRGMRQAFRDIGQGAATSMLGDQAYQDPILKDALKRDKDRKELMEMFANADTDGDGNVSEAEYKAVSDAMKARGYPMEAEKVLEEMRRDIQLGLTKKKGLREEAAEKRAADEHTYKTGEGRKLEEARTRAQTMKDNALAEYYRKGGGKTTVPSFKPPTANDRDRYRRLIMGNKDYKKWVKDEYGDYTGMLADVNDKTLDIILDTANKLRTIPENKNLSDREILNYLMGIWNKSKNQTKGDVIVGSGGRTATLKTEAERKAYEAAKKAADEQDAYSRIEIVD